MSYKNCPNCEKKLDGLLTSRYILSDSTVSVINSFHSPQAQAYCNSCGLSLISVKKTEVDEIKAGLMAEIGSLISSIPVVTIPGPAGWDYQVLEMISAQSVSGTGFISELSGSWADFTGGQSNTLANKISSGEEICKKKLHLLCALMGGNAVIGTDIDYSEVGGGKGMLMVCMAGTAVNVNLDHSDFIQRQQQLLALRDKVSELNSLPNLKLAEQYN